MPATVSLRGYISAVYTASPNLGTAISEYVMNLAAALTTGTGDTQADKVWGDTRSIAAVDDLDLNGSAIKDAFGNNLAFVDVCGVIISADAANPGNILVGAAAVSTAVLGVGAATHQRVIKPGGFDMWFSPTGFAVGAGTTDILRIDRSTGTCIYSILIIGRSA